MRRSYYVTAFGWWFSMVNGWQREPELTRDYCEAAAEIVKQVQPGVTIVEVTA